MTFSWVKVSTPTKIVLSAQGLALMYAIYKKSHVTSVVAGMSMLGTGLAEWQNQKALAAIAGGTSGPVIVANPSDIAQLAKAS